MRRATISSALTVLAVAALIGAGPAHAGRYQVEHVFKGGGDGVSPDATLIKVGGKLYGTTEVGGGAGFGTIFSFDPATGAEAVAYAFKGGADGDTPQGSLTKIGGKLYGTTLYGGGVSNPRCFRSCGTVFWFDPIRGLEKVVYAFTSNPDGRYPEGGLIEVGGLLFGTTFWGGTADIGTVFSFDPATRAETVVHSFAGGKDGFDLAAGLIEAGGKLYGTTEGGGAENANCSLGCGTVFSIDPATGAETVVYAFKGGADGVQPIAGLTNLGGDLFGTTEVGGSAGEGMVFSIDPGTGAETVVYSFGGDEDGVYPGGLIYARGRLFGVTGQGGVADSGTVFSLDPMTGVETVLHAFKGGVRGASPGADLIEVDDRLYGVSGGGAAKCPSCGTLFSLRP